MKENFKMIAEAFEKAGVEINRAEYSITTYSLNTNLSFKFNNVDEFLEFLQLTGAGDEKKVEEVNSILIKEGIDPSGFFYVNFFKTKVVEL
jgi:hypothetical protein